VTGCGVDSVERGEKKNERESLIEIYRGYFIREIVDFSRCRRGFQSGPGDSANAD